MTMEGRMEGMRKRMSERGEEKAEFEIGNRREKEAKSRERWRNWERERVMDGKGGRAKKRR